MAAETRPPRQYFRGPRLRSSRRPPNFSNCRRTARTIIHSAFLSVRQPVSQSVRLQSIRTDCLAVGEKRGDREGERASEEYLSHGTKGRRMMTPSRLGSEQPTMRRAGQRGRERGGKGGEQALDAGRRLTELTCDWTPYFDPVAAPRKRVHPKRVGTGS